MLFWLGENIIIDVLVGKKSDVGCQKREKRRGKNRMSRVIRPGWKKKKKNIVIHRVGAANKKIWMVRNGNVTRIMTRGEAEKYLRSHPGASVFCYVRKYELHNEKTKKYRR